MTIEIIKTITLGLFSFATTNIDDFLLILLFFSLGIPARKIVIGQYLGMFGIFILSYCGGSAMLFLLSPHWLGSLGIVPLIIGLREVYRRSRSNSCRHDQILSDLEGKGASTARLQTPKIFEVSKESPSKIGILTIALMTLTNGGDNIAVYSGLFAKRSLFDIFLLVTVYLILTGIWCISGSFISEGKWNKPINNFNKAIFPYAMIAIGLSILLKLI